MSEREPQDTNLLIPGSIAAGQSPESPARTSSDNPQAQVQAPAALPIAGPQASANSLVGRGRGRGRVRTPLPSARPQASTTSTAGGAQVPTALPGRRRRAPSANPQPAQPAPQGTAGGQQRERRTFAFALRLPTTPALPTSSASLQATVTSTPNTSLPTSAAPGPSSSRPTATVALPATGSSLAAAVAVASAPYVSPYAPLKQSLSLHPTATSVEMPGKIKRATRRVQGLARGRVPIQEGWRVWKGWRGARGKEQRGAIQGGSVEVSGGISGGGSIGVSGGVSRRVTGRGSRGGRGRGRGGGTPAPNPPTNPATTPSLGNAATGSSAQAAAGSTSNPSLPAPAAVVTVGQGDVGGNKSDDTDTDDQW